jgi:hypothetical protein
MRGAVPPLSLYAFMAKCSVKKAQGQLYLLPTDMLLTDLINGTDRVIYSLHSSTNVTCCSFLVFLSYTVLKMFQIQLGYLCLYFISYAVMNLYSSEQSGGSVQLTFHFHLVPRHRICEALLSLPWTSLCQGSQTRGQLYLYLHRSFSISCFKTCSVRTSCKIWVI